jgi:hypothetical protein
MLWRDPGAREELVRTTASDTDEVTGMMERWGYAHPYGSRASGGDSSGGTGSATGGGAPSSEGRPRP